MPALDTETEILEELMSDECKCEASHGEIIPVCTITATHRIATACGHQSNACQEVASAFPEIVPLAPCPMCKSPASKCWTIRLI